MPNPCLYDFVTVAPFFLLSEKNFLVVFFLMVQFNLMDDLHLLQFLTKPALNIHIVLYLLFNDFEKNQLFEALKPRL